MSETIFSKILRGELPSHKVYEDALVYAFLDIFPLSPGHTLVIPKRAAATIDALDDDSAAAIGRVLPRLSRAVMQATGATAYNILQNNGAAANQAVFHVHFHIIPRFPENVLGAGLGLIWEPGKLSATQGTALAESISQALNVSV